MATIVNIGSTGIINKKQLAEELVKALVDSLTVSFTGLNNKLTKKARSVIIQHIQASDEYKALTDMDTFNFRSEIGLTNPIERFAELFQIWSNSINVEVQSIRRHKTKILGKIVIHNIDESFADVLSSPAAYYYSYSKKLGKTKIPWLEWMLLNGDKIAVRQYTLSWGEPNKSRTKGFIMVEDKRFSWRVPPEYSGTIKDNFVTRSIKSAIPFLEAELLNIANKV